MHTQLNKPQSEIEPPWIKYPGFSPGDSFWRQSGELWFSKIWLPFWESLLAKDQQLYLLRWKIPNEWYFCEYINSDFKNWLESGDDE